MSGRSQFNPDATLSKRIKKAVDTVTTVNYTDTTKLTVSSIVYYSAKLGYTLTETFDNSGSTNIVITPSLN